MTTAGREDEVALFNEKMEALLGRLSSVGSVEKGCSGHEAVMVFPDSNVRLLHYAASSTGAASRFPLLIVYALVNRPYVLDLQPGRSTIERLTQSGCDVYLLDWGYPEPSDAWLGLDEYINIFIDSAVDFISLKYKVSPAMLGVCQGGALALCYASLYPNKISSLTTVVTPVDFQTDSNMLQKWVSEVDVEALVGMLGNVPGSMLKGVFTALKPGSLLLQKYLDFVESIDSTPESADALYNFMAMEQWISDSPDQAGTAFKEFVTQFFQQNAFMKEGALVGDRRACLSDIAAPVLNIFASRDHLVPPDSSRVLGSLLSHENYEALEVSGGHIGVFVSRKALDVIPAAIANWIVR